jgi:hypothetical protein
MPKYRNSPSKITIHKACSYAVIIKITSDSSRPRPATLQTPEATTIERITATATNTVNISHLSPRKTQKHCATDRRPRS